MDGFYRNTQVSSEMRACETKKVDNGYCNLTLYLTIIIIDYFLVYIIFFQFDEIILIINTFSIWLNTVDKRRRFAKYHNCHSQYVI